MNPRSFSLDKAKRTNVRISGLLRIHRGVVEAAGGVESGSTGSFCLKAQSGNSQLLHHLWHRQLTDPPVPETTLLLPTPRVSCSLRRASASRIAKVARYDSPTERPIDAKVARQYIDAKLRCACSTNQPSTHQDGRLDRERLCTNVRSWRPRQVSVAAVPIAITISRC